MSNGTLGNPACEGEQLIIQVMGKEHPAGHEIVIVDQYRGEQLAEFGEAEMEDLPEPTSVLHKWCWQGYQRVNAQLHIESESGEPIRLPLLEWLYKNNRKLRMQDNVIQPVLPMALWQGLGRHERHALPLRPGYLYIFYGDKLWREIQASANAESGRLEFRDIDLAAHRDDRDRYQDDRRPTAGIALEEIWLPRRANERYIDGGVRIAYSEVQWSAARINYLQADTQAQRTRCHAVNLSSANNFASPGQLYILSNEEPQRLRIDLAEQHTATPHALTHDMAGDYLSRLKNQAAGELSQFDSGDSARAAADEGMRSGNGHGEQASPLYAQASARCGVLKERIAQGESATEEASVIWDGLGEAQDCLAAAREREIPGLVLVDTLFELRHSRHGCQTSLEYLQLIPALAAQDEFYECAALVNQTILRRHDHTGQANTLRRFADKADLSDTSKLQRILRSAQRELARSQLETYQSRLHGLLLSREANAVLADLLSLEGHDYLGAYALVADLLEALRDAPGHADPLHDAPPTSPTQPQRFLVDVLRDGSSYTLHAMLFPSDEETPLDTPLVLPDEEENPGNGRVRLKALAQQAEQEFPTEEDDLQLQETAYLAAIGRAEGFTYSAELKRWGGVVDLVFGRLAEQANLLFEKSASQAIAMPAARLARVGFPELFGKITGTARGNVREDMVIIGVRDSRGQLYNGLTEHERSASRQGVQGQARQSFEGAVRQATGKTLTPSQARGMAALSAAANEPHLMVLVAEADSEAARLSRRARMQVGVAGATDMIRLPYIISAFELFNLNQELTRLKDSPTSRRWVGFSSALYDLAIASAKALEFYGERHNRLSRLRAGLISRHLPLGETLMRSNLTMLSAVGGKLRSTVTIVNLAGFVAGAASAALLAWDAWTRFQHGNFGAGIALSIASVSTAVVAGSALIKTSPLWLGLGPVGWIALGLSLAAVALSVWLTDNEIEEWLRLGPFGSNERYAWRQDPSDSFDRLVSLFANIRIRIEPIGLATAETIAQDSEQRPAGLLSPSRPMAYVDRLMAQQALAQTQDSVANTRVVVQSNLPGLATGWSQAAQFRFQIVTEYKYEHRRDGYSQWIEENSRIGNPITPLFERATTDGREYYLWVPEQGTQPGGRLGRDRRTTHHLRVRVQWRKEQTNYVELPRVLPAPAPTKTGSGDPSVPNFERTDRPYWADETTHRDKEVNNG
ncbi:toxin VasX [Billgrantia ethanolica]|uniref:Toxin VasX N-terminal region domain-containing protein n=1 Tax=Billgrantia ethanolica TaxID=2733486 RepID=A0ABS9A372_9GAMM|nr:toxin VasX [Halomonas ethanolica]MCE8002274.1 hypothetical protein [Halomonas ethanolica]